MFLSVFSSTNWNDKSKFLVKTDKLCIFIDVVHFTNTHKCYNFQPPTNFDDPLSHYARLNWWNVDMIGFGFSCFIVSLLMKQNLDGSRSSSRERLSIVKSFLSMVSNSQMTSLTFCKTFVFLKYENAEQISHLSFIVVVWLKFFFRPACQLRSESLINFLCYSIR